MRGIVVIVLLCFGWLLAGCGQSGPPAAAATPAYHKLLESLYRGTVPVIQASELAALRRQQPQLLLLDTRSPAEYRVSHLAGARLVAFDGFGSEAVRHLPRTAPVVVYCSVGVRSEKIGEQLLALGFRDVRNLYGGVFQWVNEGLPVHDSRGPTTNIHPYSALWGAWLQRGTKVYEAE